MIDLVEPLTDEEYAEWRANIEVIARGKFAYVNLSNYDDRRNDLTITIGMQLRLFATIDDLRTKLQQIQEQLERERRAANIGLADLRWKRDKAILGSEEAK